jgi:5-methylcytosine-specific restriction endonuclease McrA
MDVDHKIPLSEGGTNAISNLRLRDPNENRADKSNMVHGHARTQKYTHDAAGYGKGR